MSSVLYTNDPLFGEDTLSISDLPALESANKEYLLICADTLTNTLNRKKANKTWRFTKTVANTGGGG
ncbi:MAG: hypothetical protein ACK5H1_10040 [Tenacibaculum sp.]